MKLVGTLSSFAIARSTPEELQPRNGVAWSELGAALKERYRTDNVTLPTGQVPAGNVPLLVQGGEFVGSKGRVAIEQLWIAGGIIVAVANDTDAAGEILNDVIYFLDHSFEFRFSTASVARSFVSDLVVQFESGVGDALSALGKAEKVVAEALGRNAAPGNEYGLKRIAFGRASDGSGTVNPLENPEAVEFVIERRVKQPFSENKFYCRAPMSTGDHLAALEAIEAALKG